MKAQSRLIIVVIFLGAGALFYWTEKSAPKSTDVSFVLTDIEVAHGSQLLRHEHIVRVTCRFLDEEGQPVASIVHNRPGPVTNTTQVELPEADYNLDIAVSLSIPGGKTKTVRYLKKSYLDGTKLTVRP